MGNLSIDFGRIFRVVHRCFLATGWLDIDSTDFSLALVTYRMFNQKDSWDKQTCTSCVELHNTVVCCQ